MKISPLDIRKQTFRTVFRGADNEEVRVFLDLVATECENLLQENVQLSERVQHCEDRLVEYRQLDQTLRNSLLTAERLSAEARESSKREADRVLQDAEWRAKQMLEDARERLGRLTEEIRALQSRKDAFSQHLRSFFQGQLELLERNEGFLEGIDGLAEETHLLTSQLRRAEMQPPVPPSSPAATVEETAPPPAETAAPPTKRGLGRFPHTSDSGESTGSVWGGRGSTADPGREGEDRGPERNEGLFEISAEEDEAPPQP